MTGGADPGAGLAAARARGDAEAFARVLIAEPADSAFFEALIQGGRTGPVTALLKSGLLIEPGAGSLLTRLGNTAFGMEDFETCARMLLRAARIEVTDKALQNRAAAALFQIEDLARAEGCARRSVALDGEDPEGWFWLGRVLRAAGRYLEAGAAFRESAARDPVFAMRVRIVEQGVGPADFPERA